MLLPTILVVIIALILGLIAYAAMQPSAFRIARSTTINATPEALFPHIIDFRKWEAWSPYEKIDPAMKKTYSGADTGVGAIYEWDGNSKAGKGRMEIKEVSAPSKVTITLDFDKPMKAHNIAEFTLEPQGNATQVTWGMTGTYGLMSKVMCIFINMDKLVGGDFEKGLAQLKANAEK